MINKPSIAIIGKGKVGQSLAQLLQRSGFELSIHDRDIVEHTAALGGAQIILLTVNDDSIKGLCDEISKFCAPESIVAHCSGSLGSDVLISAKDRGCYVASTHPLNTFPNLTSSLQTFSSSKHGTYLYSEGDDKALEVLQPVFQSIGFNTVILDSAAKPAYHAACVFACNYLNVLMDLSLSSAEVAGLDRDKFWRAIQPLIRSTLSNIDVHGPSNALSGPIARGDTATVDSHLAALQSGPGDLGSAYKLLGREALRLAAERGELEDDKLAQLEELLQ